MMCRRKQKEISSDVISLHLPHSTEQQVLLRISYFAISLAAANQAHLHYTCQNQSLSLYPNNGEENKIKHHTHQKNKPNKMKQKTGVGG